jgi:pimeloyl-ACP methyl ester carboxylesterase
VQGPALLAEANAAFLTSYAQAHPAEVRGMALVDTVHESWYPALKKALSPDGWRIMEMIIDWEKNKNSHEDFAEAAQAMSARGTQLTMPLTVLSRGFAAHDDSPGEDAL